MNALVTTPPNTFVSRAATILFATIVIHQAAFATVRSSANYSQESEALNSGGGGGASANYSQQMAIGDPVLGASAIGGYTLNHGFPLVPNPAAFLLVSVATNLDRLGEVWEDEAILTFTRSFGIQFETRVEYSLSGDATQNDDYTLDDEEIVFSPGETTTQTTIRAINDLLDETTETLTLQILTSPNYLTDTPDATTIEIDRIVYSSQGDVNADQTLDILDAIALSNHLGGSTLLVGDAFDRADVDDNGSLNTADLDWIVSVILWEVQQEQ